MQLLKVSRTNIALSGAHMHFERTFGTSTRPVRRTPSGILRQSGAAELHHVGIQFALITVVRRPPTWSMNSRGDERCEPRRSGQARGARNDNVSDCRIKAIPEYRRADKSTGPVRPESLLLTQTTLRCPDTTLRPSFRLDPTLDPRNRLDPANGISVLTPVADQPSLRIDKDCPHRRCDGNTSGTTTSRSGNRGRLLHRLRYEATADIAMRIGGNAVVHLSAGIYPEVRSAWRNARTRWRKTAG